MAYSGFTKTDYISWDVSGLIADTDYVTLAVCITTSDWSVVNPTKVIVGLADGSTADNQHRLRILNTELLEANSFGGSSHISTGLSVAAYTDNKFYTVSGRFGGNYRRAAAASGGDTANQDASGITGLDTIRIGTTADSTPLGDASGFTIAWAGCWNHGATTADFLVSSELAALDAGASPYMFQPHRLVWLVDNNLGRDKIHGAAATITGSLTQSEAGVKQAFSIGWQPPQVPTAAPPAGLDIPIAYHHYRTMHTG